MASKAVALPVRVGGRAEEELYEGKNLPGGGQLEIRMTVSPYDNDPDVVEVAERMSPFNPESWHLEWKRVAEKNERLAEEFEKEELKNTANQYYLRAANFYQLAVRFQPESDPRMLPTFNKLLEMYQRAWKLVPPPFGRLEIPYEGCSLPAFFAKPRGKEGERFPVVYVFGGADSMVVPLGIAIAQFTARGMAFFFVDGPGQGVPLRLHRVYAPPDSERPAKVILDYLVRRPDVDANRIGIVGESMGGYTAPRIASGDKRVKACATSSAAYSLLEDIFEYFPPIQDRIRWLIGAKDVAEGRKKIAEYTLEGRADRIECPMLIGYDKDDRVMDPRGAYRLYEAATRSERVMVEGISRHKVGRVRPAPLGPPVIADWMAKQLGARP